MSLVKLSVEEFILIAQSFYMLTNTDKYLVKVGKPIFRIFSIQSGRHCECYKQGQRGNLFVCFNVFHIIDGISILTVHRNPYFVASLKSKWFSLKYRYTIKTVPFFSKIDF